MFRGGFCEIELYALNFLEMLPDSMLEDVSERFRAIKSSVKVPSSKFEICGNRIELCFDEALT